MLKYAELLKPQKQDIVLAIGETALPTALYLSGLTGCKAHAFVPASAQVLSEMQAMAYARKNFPDLAPLLEKGLALTTFTITSHVENPPAFTKAILVREKPDDLFRELAVLAAAGKDKKTVLLDLPFSFFRPFTVTTKKMFSKPRTLTFRQVLKECGAECLSYDASDHRLFALLDASKFAPCFQTMTQVNDAAFARFIQDDVGIYAETAKPGASFAVKTSDDEYLAFTTVIEAPDAYTEYVFVFLDGSFTTTAPGVREFAKKLTMAVVPNTPAFSREMEDKRIMIVQKENVPTLFVDVG